MLVVGDLRIPLRELRFSFSRSSGAGGQNVNKVNTKATLRWDVQRSPSLPPDVRRRLERGHARRITAAGDLVITSQRYRDQGRNVADCLEKLRRLLEAAATPPRERRPTRPSRGAVERRLDQKRHTAQRKTRRRPAREEE